MACERNIVYYNRLTKKVNRKQATDVCTQFKWSNQIIIDFSAFLQAKGKDSLKNQCIPICLRYLLGQSSLCEIHLCI